MDHELVSRQLIRALRGRRSQPWLSRRIGLGSNLVYRWEAGRAWPSAQQLFCITKVMGGRVHEGLQRLLNRAANVQAMNLESSAGVSELLKALVGSQSIQEVAQRLSKSRYIVSRWLSGKTDIRLPDLLRLVEVTTLRVLDFIAVFLDPAKLPALEVEWARLEAARNSAYDAPWSHAVLRALEVAEHLPQVHVDAAWLAQRLGIVENEVQRSLRLLAESGQVSIEGQSIRLTPQQVVDTGANAERRRQLASFWSRVACERLEDDLNGIHAFNLFTLRDSDLPRLRSLHREFFGALRALVSESHPPERVVLYTGQLLALDAVEVEAGCESALPTPAG